MSAVDLNIRLQVASLGALEAITAPRGVLALLPDGAVYVQDTAPTGANWKLETRTVMASYGEDGIAVTDVDGYGYNLEP